MRCEVCKKEVEETFLKKVLGTYIKDSKGKRRLVCCNCQRMHKKEDILSKF